MLIRTKKGLIEGKEKLSLPSKKSFYSFIGIPYAEPPVDKLRFQAPRPCEPWNGVLTPVEHSKVCIQKDFSRTIIGEEDCLYLNIHILEKPNDGNLKPVMVFIHGGGFEMGSGEEYSAEYLIEYDVIIVTVNYRLHVLGFLNLGLPECPGNVGLKDQLLALKWVKENIRAFGGDQNNITIFGESAGSASVSYLMLSPLAKGSFQKAILQSGIAMSPWAFTDEPLKHAFDLASSLGYVGSSADRKSLLEFLLKFPAEDLIAYYYKTYPKEAYLFCKLRFVPSVEFDIESESAFLPEHPEILLTKLTPLPLMTGVVDLEGLIFVLAGFGAEKFISTINKHSPSCFVPKKWSNAPDIVSHIGRKIRQFYFQDVEEITVEHFPQLIDLLSDINFNIQLYDFPRMMKKKDKAARVYIYRFNYEGELNLVKKLCSLVAPDCVLKGSCHGDELGYLFKMQNAVFEVSPDVIDRETNMIDTMCRLWTNFAKYGNPTPSPFEIEWKSMQLDEFHYMNINHLLKEEEGLVFENRLKFWESLSHEVESLDNSTRLKL